jgi:hypothetical protein
MVINQFNIECVTTKPAKTDTPLPVHPQTPLTIAIPAQLFQSV